MFTEEIYSDTPEEFLNRISLRSEHFLGVGRHFWIFRGQPSGKPLVPTALRPGRMPLGKFDDVPRTYFQQVVAEWRVLARFFRLADLRGLPIPGDTQKLRRLFLEHGPREDEAWPPDDVLPLMAIAQHHGLPTRLLDWTWDPYVAAYFAAHDALDRAMAEKGKPPGEIEVCALSIECFRPEFLKRELGLQLVGGELELVTTPSAGNINLRAQEGVFTLWRGGDERQRERIDHRGIEELLEVGTRACTQRVALELFKRFTLDATHVPWLLYLLSAEGVTGSRLFPSYDGVARELVDQLEFPREVQDQVDDR